jgi:hypothetical protein
MIDGFARIGGYMAKPTILEQKNKLARFMCDVLGLTSEQAWTSVERLHRQGLRFRIFTMFQSAVRDGAIGWESGHFVHRTTRRKRR